MQAHGDSAKRIALRLPPDYAFPRYEAALRIAIPPSVCPFNPLSGTRRKIGIVATIIIQPAIFRLLRFEYTCTVHYKSQHVAKTIDERPSRRGWIFHGGKA